MTIQIFSKVLNTFQRGKKKKKALRRKQHDKGGFYK